MCLLLLFIAELQKFKDTNYYLKGSPEPWKGLLRVEGCDQWYRRLYLEDLPSQHSEPNPFSFGLYRQAEQEDRALRTTRTDGIILPP